MPEPERPLVADTAAGGVLRWRFGDPLENLAGPVARGGILALPTESSYALGVDPRSSVGVEAIYRIKGRERGKPLPVVAASLAQLALLGVDVETHTLRRCAAFWPAPLTCVVPVRERLPASAGTGTLAVRIPAHEGLRRLLEELETPLTATSANRSGEPPLLTPEAVEALLAEALAGGALAHSRGAAVVDGGALPGGLPSTLVRPDPRDPYGRPEVLRPGRFPVDSLAWGS